MTQENTLKHTLDTLQQKAKERTVKTQNVEYDLDTLVKRIEKGTIKLDPEYQRRHRWPPETSSRLIESLVLNIPIPVIFISQDVDVDDEVEESTARYTVIDGQQRLTAIYEFLKNNYKLQGLETLEELNGMKYRDLPPFLIRRIEERTIKCLRIDSTVDSQVKFDIFERLNTGSVKLEAQELRNATARGPFNSLAKKLSKNVNFQLLLQIDPDNPDNSNKVKKMEDVELVLRFFALREDNYNNLKKGFREFLTQRLVELNKSTEPQLKVYKKEFDIYMEFIHDVVGERAFAKYRCKDGELTKMSNFNAAVFDALCVGLTNTFTANDIIDDTEACKEAFKGYEQLFCDEEFFAAVTGSVNDSAKVITRVNKMIEFLSNDD